MDEGMAVKLLRRTMHRMCAIVSIDLHMTFNSSILADNVARDSHNTVQSMMLYVCWHPPARSWSSQGLEYQFLVVFVSTDVPSILRN